MVGTSDKENHIDYNNNHTSNNNHNNKVNLRNTHTRWNSDNQIITNNIHTTTTQLHKRDEWHDQETSNTINSNSNNNNYPIKRRQLSVSTSFQQPLAASHSPPSDHSSLSKLIAQRRASAPIVSVAQQQARKNAQQQVIAQHNTQGAPRAHNDPRIRSKGASKEVYGFVCWITTFVAYAFYLLWGFLPKQLLQSLGVHYFPNRYLLYWVIAIPSYLMVAILFGILTYVCFNLINTPPLNSFHCFSDNPSTPEHYQQEHENSIPAARDIPLSLINELLYQKKKPGSDLSPTFSKFGNPHTARSRVYFDNKNKSSTEDLRDWDASFSSTDSAENSESESSSSHIEYPKRSNHFSSFSSSPESSPIRRTSSYNLLKEDT